MLTLHSSEEIALRLFASRDLPPLHQPHRLAETEIALDHVFLDYPSAKNETTGRDVPLAKLGDDWWVFAVAGTGDAWLVSMDGIQRIAFLDHDQGPDALPQKLHINLSQWLQLADVMQQFEAALDTASTPTLVPDVESLLEQISEGLLDAYPYTLSD